jgi:glucose 1-dehydrogenase
MDMPLKYAHLPAPVMPRVPPQPLLLGQKALVTGASSGIGRAIAVALAEAGADVVVNYNSGEDKAQALVTELRAKGVQAIAIKANVAEEDQVLGMYRRMLEEFGTIDILVNNAGLQQDGPFHELTLAQWNKVIGVNLTGQFLCSREAVREFRRRGVRQARLSASAQCTK